MKQMKYEGNLLAMLFIALTYLFSRSHFSIFFIIILCVLLLIAFFREENRLFSWVMIAFFGGSLIFLYVDKFLGGYIDHPFLRIIISQLLWIIPILSMCYVIMQFNQEISRYLKKPKLDGVIHFLDISISVKRIIYTLLIIMVIFLAVFFYLVDAQVQPRILFSIFLFAITYAISQEIIWRGILLTQLSKIANENLGVFFTSIGFGINTTIFGFSPLLFILYLVLGMFFGFMTIKFNSIFPSIFIHTIVLIVFFLSGWLIIPI